MHIALIRIILLIAFMWFSVVSLTPQAFAQGDKDAEIAQAMKGIKWSQNTNGVQFGFLLIPLRSGNVITNYDMTLTLYSPETRRIIMWLPPEPQRYALELRHEKGGLVKRTERGRHLGRRLLLPEKPLQASGFRQAWAMDREYNTIMPRIRLDDWFQIRSRGKFTLTGQARAVVVVGSDKVVPTTFDLPPITLELMEN